MVLSKPLYLNSSSHPCLLFHFKMKVFTQKKKKKALRAKTHSLLYMHCRLRSSPKKLPGHTDLKHMIVEEMKIEAVMTANIPVQL